MVEVVKGDQWYIVRLKGEELGMFGHRLDAIRFAIAMLNDGLASSVDLGNGIFVEP